MFRSKYILYFLLGLVFIVPAAHSDDSADIFGQDPLKIEQMESEIQWTPFESSFSLVVAQAAFNQAGNDDAEGPAPGGQYTEAQINEMINNPLGELWLLFVQNDTTWYKGDALDFLGEDDKVFNTTTIQPVMPFQLTENWKYIFRPVITVNNWDVPSASEGTPTFYPGGELPFNVDWDRKWALGDTVLWNAFATNEMATPPNILGFGVTLMLPTATDDAFGTNKWSAGPMALAVHVGPPGGWIAGVVAQHWWDYAGPSDEDHVSLSNIQYLLYYRLTDATNIGFGPNITADWTADSDQRWTVPVGLGFNTTTKIGPLPVKVGLEVYTYVEKPDNFGPDWGIRLIFSPIVPKPAFSKKPIFGN
jgi:hypothetical protein